MPVLPRVADSARLRALWKTRLLDSEPETAFDNLTRLVRQLLNVPSAMVSLVDSDRQWFKSAQGLPEPWASRRQTPLSHSFCKHVVQRGEPLVVDAARENPLVKDNLGIRELGIEAYLGVPLVLPGGEVIGSLCAIDGCARRWTDDDQALLGELARCVMAEVLIRDRSDHARTVQSRLARIARPAAALTLAAAVGLSLATATLEAGHGIIALVAAVVLAAGFATGRSPVAASQGISVALVMAAAIALIASALPAAWLPALLPAAAACSIMMVMIWLDARVVAIGSCMLASVPMLMIPAVGHNHALQGVLLATTLPVSLLAALLAHLVEKALRAHDATGMAAAASRAAIETLTMREAGRRSGEERHRAELERTIKALQGSIGAILAGLELRNTQVQEAAEHVASLTRSAAANVAVTAKSSAVSVEKMRRIAETAEDLLRSIQGVGSRSDHTQRLTHDLGREFDLARRKVESLAHQAGAISSVVEIIADLTDQTNLLALNATIEAARAGPAGRGFAVVASEVKSLAAQTAGAAEAISSHIGAIQASVGETVAMVGAVSERMTMVARDSGAVTQAVTDQIEATSVIHRSITEMEALNLEVADNMEQVATASERALEGTTRIRETTQELIGQNRDIGARLDAFAAVAAAGEAQAASPPAASTNRR